MNELVPQRDIRIAAGSLPAFNDRGDVHLPEVNHYDDRLTSAERQLIAKHVEIHLYFGAHNTDPSSYAFAREVLSKINPTKDVLLVEGVGYHEADVERDRAGIKAFSPQERRDLEDYIAESLTDPGIDLQEFNAFFYAMLEAHLNNIHMEIIDFDFFDEKSWKTLRGLATLRRNSGFEHPLVYDDEYNRQRTRIAMNKTKTLALQRARQCEKTAETQKVHMYGLVGLAHKDDVEAYGARLRLPLFTYADPSQVSQEYKHYPN
jgi:hypothetical protein